MKLVLYCLLISFLLLRTASLAQDREIDSLVEIYKSGRPDSIRLQALNKLFEVYRYSDDSLAVKYAGLSIDLASASHNGAGLALALYNKAVLESEHGNFDSSDQYVTRALKTYNSIADKTGAAKCQMAFGFNRYDQGYFPEALARFIEAAKYMESAKNNKGISSAYIWIGNVYNNGLLKPREALVYYSKALRIQQESGDAQNMAFTLNNIGNVNFFLKAYDSALVYYKRSADLKEKLGNRKGLSASYNNIGNVYNDLGQYADALGYYKRSLEIRVEFGDKKGIVTSNINIGNVFIKRKKFREAIAYHTSALLSAEEIGDKEGMKEAANGLSTSYESIGDSKKALDYFKYSARVNDSLVNRDFNERIAEMQTRYETEKKEAENKALKGLNTISALEIMREKQKNFIKNIIIAAALLILAMLSYLAYVISRKRKIQQEAELVAERGKQKELRINAVIEAEEKERRRIAQDLHDGIGQILSAAKLNLSSLEPSIAKGNHPQELAFKNTLDLIDDSVREVRSVSHNMMPNTLIKLGLATALREFITKIGGFPELKIDLEIVGLDKRLEENTETVLYRVIQEAVNNILKHANANKIGIQLIRHDNELSVVIEDNGVGFDVQKINEFSGIGLKNIVSRVEFINGKVHFDSTPGKGTTVVIDVPLI